MKAPKALAVVVMGCAALVPLAMLASVAVLEVQGNRLVATLFGVIGVVALPAWVMMARMGISLWNGVPYVPFSWNRKDRY